MYTIFFYSPTVDDLVICRSVFLHHYHKVVLLAVFMFNIKNSLYYLWLSAVTCKFYGDLLLFITCMQHLEPL